MLNRYLNTRPISGINHQTGERWKTYSGNRVNLHRFAGLLRTVCGPKCGAHVRGHIDSATGNVTLYGFNGKAGAPCQK